MSWTDPIPQHYPAHEPDGVKKLVGAVQRTAQQARDSTKNLLRTAGLFVSENGMRVESALVVNGDLNATGNTDIDGTLNVDATSTFGGDSTFHGSVVIDGNLAVPNGSISNEALQNPIEEGAIGYSASAFTVPTSATAVATRTMNIPAGFAQASVMVVVSFGVWNPTTTAGYFYGRATIDGTSGAGLPALVQPSGYGTVTTSAIRTLDNLTPGGQITVSATCNGPSGWGAAASNVVNIDAIAIFRR